MTPSDQPVRTTCAYCGVGCGVLATPRQDGSVEISGDPDHPANYGRLCSKGSALGDTLGLEDRLLYPEIKGKRVDWNAALDHVATQFFNTIKRHGPDSVAFYVSGQILTEDYYVANKLMKGFIGSANIDTNSRLCMASSVAGHRRAFGADTVPNTYEDLEIADLIVLVGSNLAWCHPVIYQRIEAAKKNNPDMKIVVIDPRETLTCAIADLHLPIAADGDEVLFAGLLNRLAVSGAVDRQYIDKFTSNYGTVLEAVSELSVKNVASSAQLTEEDVETFYGWYAKTEKVVTVYSQGVNQSRGGTDKVNAIINCHLATGRIGKPGSGPFSVTGQPNAMGGREVGGLANMLAAHLSIENDDDRALVQKFWKTSTIASKAGLKAVDLFKAIESGDVKAVWIMGTNPVDSMPEANRVRAALEKCDLVVVSDILDNTDTIKTAHVRLPAAAWGEKSGTVTNSERRISRQRSFLKGPGETRPDWWQICEVAKKMGFEDGFDYQSEADIFREHAALSACENDGKRDFDIGAFQDISDHEYNTLLPFQWPQRVGEHRKTTRFFADGGFYTSDYRARFFPFSRELVTSRTLSDFTLNTGRVRDHWHTMTRTGKSVRLSEHMAEPYCEIHPSDARRLDIGPADLVEISNEFGRVFARVLVSARQKRGNLFVPMHWTDQFASNARIDTLVPMTTDPVSGQPALKNVSVKLKRFDAKMFGFWVGEKLPESLQFPYWALARCRGGWRVEFASLAQKDFDDLETVFRISSSASIVSYVDQANLQYRCAWFEGARLAGLLFVSSRPVHVDRTWAVEQVGQCVEDDHLRQRLIAGRPGRDQPAKGRIVCACNSVGVNDIARAQLGGATTVEEIGFACQAGTGCGSCRSEIASLLESDIRYAAE